MSDETTTRSDETTATDRVGFCQDCGKPLTKETVRIVGTGMFCEPCLHARLTASQNVAGTAPAAGYTQAVPPVPPMGKLPNPVLAGFLSIIPGVGQVYNGQYLKGIVILLICAVLNSIGKNNHLEVFGIVAFGWWVYQIVDAYQTAKARVEGRPLPNPFELNDIGDKLGFGKGFGTSAEMRAAAYGTVPVTPSPTPGTSAATAAAQAAQTAPSTPWMPVNQNPPPAPVTPTANGAGYSSTAGAVPPVGTPYVAPVPPTPYSAPYSTPQALPPMPAMPLPPIPAPGSSFPLVAIWLIGLGVLFALAEWVPSWHVNGTTLVAILLGALAASIFVRRLGYMGGLSYPGPVLHMMRGPMILAVLAVLFLLDGIHAATIMQTWPVVLLALGAVLLGERLGVGTQPYPQNYQATVASVVPPAPAETSEAAPAAAPATEPQHNDDMGGYTR